MRKENPTLTPAQEVRLLKTDRHEWVEKFPQHSQEFLKRAKREIKANRGRLPIAHRVEVDARESVLVSELATYRRSYSAALKENAILEKQIKVALDIKDKIVPKTPRILAKRGAREATAIILASDWHCEEPVDPASVNDLNEYSLDTFDKRSGRFFRSAINLLDKEAKSVDIKNTVLHLGGDFISGTIHDDLAESVALSPIGAVLLAQDVITGGIQAILGATPKTLNLTIVCSVGNHERITKERRIQTRTGNSLAFLMYANLSRFFAKESRVSFVLPSGYHSYVDVHGFMCRFHHGDEFTYRGGIGGITIPANKMIAQWNRGRAAAYDFFGHFHTFFDGGNFVSNGSLMGYNPYALSIGASFEIPKQAFILIDSKRGKTGVFPIFVED